jgi:hypothetical protein
MTIIRTLGIAALALAAGAGAASAAVEVSFQHPERYTDAGLYWQHGPKAQAPTLKGIRRHLEKLSARYLRPGQSLRIQVLDIDLAGRYEPWRPFASDVRIMREITWPRIALRYELEQNGQVVASAEETLRDMNYLMRPRMGSSGDPLYFEKVMLDDWFRRRIVEQHPASGG